MPVMPIEIVRLPTAPDDGTMGQSPGAQRPSWDEYFAQIALTVATRSTCPRLSVGCVLVCDRRIVATGYNGAPPALPQCDEVGCDMQQNHCVRTVHAEENALRQAQEHREDFSKSIAYVTHQPCTNCATMLDAAGITKVVYQYEYPPLSMKEQRYDHI